MWLRGGASAGSASANAATAAGVPSASTSTPAEVLRTQPRTPQRAASEYTKGRKPTPWTTPRTLMRTAALDALVARRREGAHAAAASHSGQRNW